MKSILAFGDSLTWGYHPAPEGVRHGVDHRWPLVLEKGLGGHARVIEEGLPGRTTCHDSGFLEHHNGLKALPMIMQSHLPLDLVIIMLGTNDLQAHIGSSAANVARGIHRLIHCVRTSVFEQQTMRYPDLSQPEILIISPPEMIYSHTEIRRYFGDDIASIDELKAEYQKISNISGTHLMHASAYCKPSDEDGVHLSAEETAKLGQAMVPIVKTIVNIA